jgi:6-hydroxycyclohex-1-ene-1-carbonyl-CoA dehydrogenase
MSATPARGLFLRAPGILEFDEFELADPEPGEALVRVAGCGVCHTDLSFYSGAVRTRAALPLILGHEISGTVDAAGAGFEHLVGRSVIVPAVMPCEGCDVCAAGHDNACPQQVMPGNDIHGGFATHALVPARHLLPLENGLAGPALAELAVVADAVTTPYQAIRRAGVAAGDLVIVVGVGGIGTYAVQIARAMGAEVAAVDVDPRKLARAADLGSSWVFDARERDGRAIRKALACASGIATPRWRILEMSGTRAGQELAWALLPPAGTLAVVGFTMECPDIRLSNLMALDATAVGTWGCSPRHYAAVVDLVQSGHVRIGPFVDCQPLADGPELFRAMADGAAPSLRAVLVPE